MIAVGLRLDGPVETSSLMAGWGHARLMSIVPGHQGEIGYGSRVCGEARSAAGDLARAAVEAQHPVEAEHTSQLTPAETRVLQLLPTHPSLTDIANELVASRNTVKSQAAGIYH
jgi:hypothetical protein